VKIGMLFPGYGSQFVGMGKKLYDDSRIMQEFFEEASSCLDQNFVKLCFASSERELALMENAYPAIFLMSCSLARILQEHEGIKPDVIAGYNIGEYAAFFSAGGFLLHDGLYLLNKLSQFYSELQTQHTISCIRVIGMQKAELEQLCLQVPQEYSVSVAVYHSDTDHIVTGIAEGVDILTKQLVASESNRIETVDPAVGLHSALMNPVAQNLTPYLEKVDFKDLETPVLATTGAGSITHGTDVKQQIIRQLCEPVRWSDLIAQCSAYDLLIEVGPGSTLTAMVHSVYPDKQVIAINEQEDIDKLVTVVTGGERVEDRDGTV